MSPVVPLDLRSPFDTDNHDSLLRVLQKQFSVKGPVLDWFQSYLSDRSQTFITSNNQSDLVPAECSVLQGSVLGPVHFIVKMPLSCSTNMIEGIICLLITNNCMHMSCRVMKWSIYTSLHLASLNFGNGSVLLSPAERR